MRNINIDWTKCGKIQKFWCFILISLFLMSDFFFLLDFNKHAEMLFTFSGHVDKYKCEVFYKQYI